MKCPPEAAAGQWRRQGKLHGLFFRAVQRPIARHGVWSAKIPADWPRKREAIESQRYRDAAAAANVIEAASEMEGDHLGFFTEFATEDGDQVQMKAGFRLSI